VSVFGDGAEGFAADGGGVQLQRICSGCAAQDITAAALLLRLQAAALEKDLQRLLRGVITAQAGAAFVAARSLWPAMNTPLCSAKRLSAETNEPGATE
jgi:hypothetical protein